MPPLHRIPNLFINEKMGGDGLEMFFEKENVLSGGEGRKDLSSFFI